MSTSRWFSLSHLLALPWLAFAACSGSIGDGVADPGTRTPGPETPGNGGTTSGPAVVTPPPSKETAALFACKPGTRASSPARIWRLSGAQYANTLRALPGLAKATFTNPLQGADGEGRFKTYSIGQGLPEALATGVLDTSAALAPQVVTALKTTTPCLANPDAACVKTTFATLGAKAYRRPLTTEEADRLTNLVTSNLGPLGAQMALELGVRALLTSPYFTFRTELGDGPVEGGVKRLGTWELASALSYTLTDGPPDDELVNAVSKGALSTPEQLRAQATRLLGQPGANAALARFLREYYRYENATEVFKDAKESPHHAPAELIADTDAFLKEVAGARRDLLKTMLTATWGFARAKTAASYNLPAMTGTSPQKVEFPAGQRAGILTQPSFLTAFSQSDHNDPIRRGKFIAQSLLCIDLPDTVPDNVPPLPETENATLREKLKVHATSLPTCKACHDIMDPLGLGLEGYDHTGRHRTTELGRPVDTSGAIVGTGTSLDGPYNGAVALGAKLAAAPLVEACFVRHSLRFFLGRAEGEQDNCAMAAAQDAFRRGNGDMGELILSLLTSESFVYRKVQ